MSAASFAQYLAVAGTLPKLDQTALAPVRLGFLGPLSGTMERWGRPGLHGCEIWVDWLNSAGGILIGKQRHRVELVSYDTADSAELAEAGARHLVEQQQVSLLMTLGGDPLQGVHPYLTKRKVLTSTLLPSDLSPDTPYLIAPSEIHPVYAVTGVTFLCRTTRPRSVALCAQTDAMGLPSLATYRAAFAAEGVPVVEEVQYDPLEGDAGEIVAKMMAANPDVLCWCTSAPPMVQRLTKAAYKAGFKGQILSCTADGYDQMCAATSVEFMEGFTFQFPDFDDPALAEKAFFFHRPAAFYLEYTRRFPGEWSAVSWEYAAILDIWHGAVEQASSVNSVSVLAAMKQRGRVTHAFGAAEWWGSDLFGIDNALVGDWPVVQIRGGKAEVVSFESVPAWLAVHEGLLTREMQALGQMWYQRRGAKVPAT